MRDTRTKNYDVAQNPNDHLWYVIGNCGGGKWMPCSDGFKNRDDAVKRISVQLKADKAAVAEIQI